MLALRASLRAARAGGAYVLLPLIALALLVAGCGAPSTGRASQAGATTAPGMTLVVMGASDAFGIGSYDPDRINWPALLASDLPQPTRLVNLGIPGATLAQARQEELPVALAQRPHIAVIWLAVNDISANVPLATYTAELRATLAAFHSASPQTRVFVGNVPDLTRLPYFADRDPATLRAQVNAWNAAIAQTVTAEGATLADLYSGWGQFDYHPQYISQDGLHPSAAGAAALADYLDILIRRTMRLPG